MWVLFASIRHTAHWLQFRLIIRWNSHFSASDYAYTYTFLSVRLSSVTHMMDLDIIWQLAQWCKSWVSEFRLNGWLVVGSILGREAIKWLLLGWVTVWSRIGKPSRYITNTKVNSAFHPSGVGKSSTGLFGLR